MKEIRVLMLVPNLRVSNGVASYAMNYYRTMDHSMIHMDFVTYQNIESPYIEEIRNNGGEVYVLSPVKNIIKHSQECLSIIRNGHYDIIHDNSLLITLPFMHIARKYVGIRILHSHSARLGETDRNEERNKLLLPFLLRTVNVYAACSDKAGRALFGEKKFVVIPNVIHSDNFKFNDEARNRVRDIEDVRDKRIIGTVGRLTDAKNPFFAIDVFEEAKKKDDDIIYWWIGSGALDKQVAEYIHEKKLDKHVRLFGSRSDVPDLLQALDLFFLPSKNEGFGLACLEASATGVPCLVSDAFPEEINVTGTVKMVSLKKRKEEWAGALLDLLANEIDREKAYERICQSHYSDISARDILLNFYRSTLNGNN